MLHWEGEVALPLSFIDEPFRASWGCAGWNPKAGAGGSRAPMASDVRPRISPSPVCFFLTSVISLLFVYYSSLGIF